MASDGLWNHLPAVECFQILVQSLQNQNQTLSEHASSSGSSSNVSHLFRDVLETSVDISPNPRHWYVIDSHINPQDLATNDSLTPSTTTTPSGLASPPISYLSRHKSSFKEMMTYVFQPLLDPSTSTSTEITAPTDDHVNKRACVSGNNSNGNATRQMKYANGLFDHEKSFPIADRLLRQCIINATNNSGVTIRELTTQQWHRWYGARVSMSTRDVVDDVTILVIPLNPDANS